MELTHRWIDRNLTRSELIIAILVLAIMLGVFYRHMILVFSQAERSMVFRTVNNINSALNYRASSLVMRSQWDAFNKLLEMNPFEDMRSKVSIEKIDGYEDSIYLLLANETVTAPLNYGGVVDETMLYFEKSKWYFNKNTKKLIYTIKNTEFFDSDLNGQSRILFKIHLEYNDNDGNGIFDSELDEFKNIKLRSVNDYFWIN